jgi:uncharacterized membrane protein YobD (UPF0266 family)
MHNPSFKTASVIISNYLSLFPALIALFFLYNGSRMLVRTIRGKKTRKLDLRWHAPWFLLLCVGFSHLTIENQYRSHSYHLSIWLLVVTYIVPYLYTWMLGLLTAYDLRVYATGVNGLVYKQAVRQFANGIAVVMLGSITIQFVTVTIAQRFSDSLGAVLLFDYGLLIFVAIGLILMALGTKKLKLIEGI